MRDLIIQASMESLRQEGLKFSVDTLAERLNISKKTVYKYFPNKEALALALYEKYYAGIIKQAELLAAENPASSRSVLLHLYFDSKSMTRRAIFNKYQLNETIRSYTAERNDALWNTISTSFEGLVSPRDKQTFRIIVDGSFEKLCDARLNPDEVIERLLKLL